MANDTGAELPLSLRCLLRLQLVEALTGNGVEAREQVFDRTRAGLHGGRSLAHLRRDAAHRGDTVARLVR